MVCRTSKLPNQALDLRAIQQSRDASMTIEELELRVIKLEERIAILESLLGRDSGRDSDSMDNSTG
jgi:hypothetical protein